MTLLELAAKVEAAEGPTFGLMSEAFDLCFPKPPTRRNDLGNWTAEYILWHAKQSAFCAFLDVGAWENAAIMLVPEGWAWMVGCSAGEGFFATLSPTDESGIEADMVDTIAATSALALTAAAIRARSENPA